MYEYRPSINLLTQVFSGTARFAFAFDVAFVAFSPFGPIHVHGALLGAWLDFVQAVWVLKIEQSFK